MPQRDSEPWAKLTEWTFLHLGSKEAGELTELVDNVVVASLRDVPKALPWQRKPAEIPRGGSVLYGAFGDMPEYRVVEWGYSKMAGHHAWLGRNGWVGVRDPKAWIVLEPYS